MLLQLIHPTPYYYVWKCVLILLYVCPHNTSVCVLVLHMAAPVAVCPAPRVAVCPALLLVNMRACGTSYIVVLPGHMYSRMWTSNVLCMYVYNIYSIVRTHYVMHVFISIYLSLYTYIHTYIHTYNIHIDIDIDIHIHSYTCIHLSLCTLMQWPLYTEPHTRVA
jgi:hypothetical protein